MRHPPTPRPLCAIVAATLALMCSLARAEDAWVQGTWVNLRNTAGPSATVKGQLTTNTLVQVTAREGEWCAVRVAATSSDGYLHCSLIAAAPLSLAQAKDQPGRAFWIAPSASRLMAYGAVLRKGAAYQRMYNALNDGETARIPPLPEFDAAKRLMAAGVTPHVDTEINRGSSVAPKDMEFFNLLKPTPIQSSYFKAHGDIVLLLEGSGDSLAAVARSKIALKATLAPTGYVERHMGPEISGISGFGDVGDAELHFSPLVLVYALMPNGLLTGAYLSKQVLPGTPEYGEGCGMTYLGNGIGSPVGDGALDMKAAPGFPRAPESIVWMASFVTAKPLPTKKLTIRSRAARVKDLPQPPQDSGNNGPQSSVPMAIPKVVLHEVDFDADGVADILVWDAPSIGGMSGGFNLRRAWYLNINGKWYPAGAMDDQECT
jgi:hypothetical protein